ncbi:MAG: AraC family transcriptional regulator [Clostridiales bacterium]|nr:AraC family transcriptional regulator [Clostridiales bacterium]
MEIEMIEAVERMQRYIDAHLGEPVTLRQLAAEAGYSPYHAARAFKELAGETPFEYLRKRRLTEAALRLRDGDERVIDVAIDFLFGTQEGFGRAFQRAFGLPPGRYRRETPPIPLFAAYSARERYLAAHRQTGEDEAMELDYTARVVALPERTMLVRRGREAADYFAYCDEVGCDVWGVLCSAREALNEPMGLWLPEALRPEGTSRYIQGVEVPQGYAAALPEGFELCALPACEMLVLQSGPFDDERFQEAIGVIWDAFERYDLAASGYRWADDEFPRFQMAPEGARGYIEGRPIKPIL